MRKRKVFTGGNGSLLFDETLLREFKKQLAVKEGRYFYNYARLSDLFPNMPKICESIKECCSGGVDKIYAENACNKCNNDPDTDMLFLLSEPLEQITYENFKSKLLAFVITERGECKKFPDIFCVKLICSTASKGGIAMACFLYCMMNHPSQYTRIAFLELASGYENIAGFCLYQKFGFQPDESLRHADCYRQLSNLPMSCEFYRFGKTNEEQSERLIAIVNNDPKAQFEKEPLCYIKPKEKQLLAAKAMKRLYLIDKGSVSNRPISESILAEELLDAIKYSGDTQSMNEREAAELFLSNLENAQPQGKSFLKKYEGEIYNAFNTMDDVPYNCIMPTLLLVHIMMELYYTHDKTIKKEDIKTLAERCKYVNTSDFKNERIVKEKKPIVDKYMYTLSEDADYMIMDMSKKEIFDKIIMDQEVYDNPEIAANRINEEALK